MTAQSDQQFASKLLGTTTIVTWLEILQAQDKNVRWAARLVDFNR
jgi:hypothetical protein